MGNEDRTIRAKESELKWWPRKKREIREYPIRHPFKTIARGLLAAAIGTSAVGEVRDNTYDTSIISKNDYVLFVAGEQRTTSGVDNNAAFLNLGPLGGIGMEFREAPSQLPEEKDVFVATPEASPVPTQ